MTAVYKRELRSYFTSMVGYVFIAILIFFVGIYFMAYNLFGRLPLLQAMSCSAAPSSSWWPFPSSPCAPWRRTGRARP